MADKVTIEITKTGDDKYEVVVNDSLCYNEGNIYNAVRKCSKEIHNLGRESQ